MADGNSRSGPSRLPIKVILPRQGRERSVPGGGSRDEPFRPVDSEFRRSLGRQISALRNAIAPLADRTGSVPARVNLHARAVAKSHRPRTLFSAKTCPIIGAGELGELFIKTTPKGLDLIADRIETGHSRQIVKELSTILTVEPITPGFRCSGRTARDILRDCPRRDRGFLARVRLFEFPEQYDSDKIYADFRETCRKNEIEFSSNGYSDSSLTYGVNCRSVDAIEALANTIGVRSIAAMPFLRSIHPRYAHPASLPSNLPSPNDFETSLPTVAVVDSGVSDRPADLNTWVVGRDSSVAPAYRNEDHGTFVAGLVAWGDRLNPTISAIDSSPCKVFDLQVLPNADPSRGPTDTLTESEFLQTLETALRAHADHVKVWNLSLGLDDICSLDNFSELAVELDDLQERYQVTFVISAGNYTRPPLLSFPRRGAELDRGRITSPADSVLGISVGSISHATYGGGDPKANEPSAFSRHGPGPNYTIKPDVVHYGGSSSLDAKQRTGIRSVTSSGTAEDCGTSFSAPLVARNLAHIYHRVIPTPAPVLARALLVHHARDPRTGGRVPQGNERNFGFGQPAALASCLECTPFSSTLVFEDTLRPGYFLEWLDFPYPASLFRDGRYFGEIWMTVAYAPTRGARWGAEYCQTRVQAHFGVYVDQMASNTGQIQQKFKGLVAPEHKNHGQHYDSQSIESLRQWTPVRTYYGNLSPKGQRGHQWRLMVRSFTRHGIAAQGISPPQPFSLILTIADPEGKAPVYDELARAIRNRFATHNLTVRPSVHERSRLAAVL